MYVSLPFCKHTVKTPALYGVPTCRLLADQRCLTHNYTFCLQLEG